MKSFHYLILAAFGIIAGAAAHAQAPPIRWMKPGAHINTPLAFSPDGNLFTSRYVGGVQFVDPNTGEIRALVPGSIYSAAFSPNGRLIACAASAGRVFILDPNSFKPVDTLHHSTSGNTDNVRFTPDGAGLVIMNSQGGLAFWDMDAGAVLHRFPGMSEVDNFSISPDSDVLAALRGQRVMFYNLKEGTLRDNVEFPGAFSIRFSPDGEHLLVATMIENNVSLVVWDYKGHKIERTIPLPARGPVAHFVQIPRIVVTPDGRYAAASSGSDSSLLFFDLETGAMGQGLYFNAPIYGAEFSPDGRYLAIGGRGLHIHILAASTFSYLRDISLGGTSQAAWLVASRDGRSVGVTDGPLERKVRVWDVATGTPVRTFIYPSTMEPAPSSFTPDGSAMMLPVDCANGAQTAQIRSFESGALLRTLSCDTGFSWKRMVALHPDGRGLLVMRDDGWGLIDVESGMTTGSGAHPRIDGLTLSGDGRHIASSGKNGRLRVFETETGRLLNDIHVRESGYSIMSMTSDGAYVAASGGESGIHVWGIGTADYRVFQGAQGTITGLAFSPDGRLLLATSQDGGIHVWKVSSSLRLYTYRAPQLEAQGGWNGIVIAPDFSSFTTIGRYGAVVNWSTDPLIRLLGVPAPPAMAPESIDLSAYPNPASAGTDIRLHLAARAHGTLRVYDALGRTVATIAEGAFEAGDHTYRWDSDVPPGHYIISMQVEGGVVVCPLLRVE